MFLIRYLAFQRLGAVVLEHFLLVTCVLTLRFQTGGPGSYATWLGHAFVVAITFQIFLHLKDLYEFGTKPWALKFVVRFGQAMFLACTLLVIFQQILPGSIAAPDDFLLILLLSSAVLALWHFLVRIYFRVSNRRSKLLIVGTGTLARSLATEIIRHRELGLSVCGFVDDDPALVGLSIVNPKVLGLYKELRQIVSDNGVDRVVVELGDRRGRLPIDELLNLKMRGVRIEEATSLYEYVTGKIAVQNLKPSWMVFGEGFEVSRRVLFLKELVSFSTSFLLFVFFLPLFPLIALLIKLDSPGPVFYRQERLGQRGKTFCLWKFRSMRRDAEQGTGPVWASSQDARVTRVGKFLRRTRLDELPQLINILKSDMTLVGPRPERPKFVEELSAVVPFYNLRHSVKPGVTGWAQINYRYGNTIEDSIEKLQYDLFYIKNISCALDLLVIFNTIKTVLVRRGS